MENRFLKRAVQGIKEGARAEVKKKIVEPLQNGGVQRFAHLHVERNKRTLSATEQREYKDLKGTVNAARLMSTTRIGRKITDWLAED